MIWRALELREALDTYAVKLSISADLFDQETFNNNYLKEEE